ncbi:MAG: UMP kinase [Thaumarchaeota archaeon]|nr:UMP kinase [Nitrososphaerota archaeon]
MLRIGGSILGSPPDSATVLAYASIIHKLIEQGNEVAVVVGGGKIAREYIEAARSLGLSRSAQDSVAIQASRLNARLVGLKLGAPSVPTSVGGMVSRLRKRRIAVMGGLKPGITTDTVATLIAEAWHSDALIKASNQDGIYTSDPRTDKSARLLHKVSYQRLVEILGGTHSPGIHSIVDPVAVEMIAKQRIRLIVVNGERPENVLDAVEGRAVGTLVS